MANCLLASCECRGGGKLIREERVDRPVHVLSGAGVEIDRRTGTRTTAGAIPSTGNDNTGRYSAAAAVLNTARTAASLIIQHTQLVSCIVNTGGFSHLGVREYSEP